MNYTVLYIYDAGIGLHNNTEGKTVHETLCSQPKIHSPALCLRFCLSFPRLVSWYGHICNSVFEGRL
jgi:hypothetical protein